MAKKRKAMDLTPTKAEGKLSVPTRLLGELRELIQSARSGVAQVVNSSQVLLYWQVGYRLRTEILGEKRAGYGEHVFQTVAEKLSSDQLRRGAAQPE